jgi:multiple sugar transport system permease protein
MRVPAVGSGKRRSGPPFRQRVELGLLLTPYLIGTFVLVALPIIATFGLAFTNYDALAAPEWAGLWNFREVLADPRFGAALGNSLYFVAVAVPLRLGATLVLALLLCRPRPGVGAYRAAVYAPTVIPEAAYALIWLWVFNPLYGPVNLGLATLGLPAPAWLADAGTAKLVFVSMACFQIGEGLVVLLVGLKDIPPEFYDTASLEGGSRLAAFTGITLPLLTPWLALLSFRDVVMSFQYTFTFSFLMTGGDPYYATLFLPLLAYEQSFDEFRFGPGSVIVLVIFLITAAAVAGLYAFFRAGGHLDEG